MPDCQLEPGFSARGGRRNLLISSILCRYSREVALQFLILVTVKSQVFGTTSRNQIRYVAIGDSYSIGEGASPGQSWPSLLTQHLASEGIKIALVANPSVTGWTTQQAVDRELPVFRNAKPGFATLLIGVNDWVQEVSEDKFRRNFNYLVEQMLACLADRNRLLIITIPDFSVTPEGPKYARGRDVAQGLAHFNQIIKEEAAHRSLRVVDIFPASQRMREDPTLVARDGLHPSAKAYAEWEKIIFPAAFELLRN
jgi:lysophospholipase L1-like esterase